MIGNDVLQHKHRKDWHDASNGTGRLETGGRRRPPACSIEMRAAAEEAADLLRSIGSPYRLMILCLLMENEKTVTEICEAIGARQSLTSQHLTRLRLDGLVKAERRGHYAYYSLTDTIAKDIVSILYEHYCAGHGAKNNELIDARQAARSA